MQNLYNTIRYGKGRILLIAFFMLFMGLYSCVDEPDKVFRTMEEDLVTSFLEKDTATYSEFLALMAASGLDGLMSAYGVYTCFIPTNEAIRNYYREYNTSLEQLTPEEIKEIAFSHVIKGRDGDNPIESIDFPFGRIKTANMNDRYIQISISSGDDSQEVTIMVNKTSPILKLDQKVHNGVIHTVGKVLEASDTHLPEVIAADERFTIFSEALNITGLSDSIRKLDHETYVYRGKVATKISYENSKLYETPKMCNYGYTLLMESDELFAKNEIYSIDDLKRYAAKVYDALYPDDSGVSDLTARNNSLNRFVAYHILERMLDVNDFIDLDWVNYFVPQTVFYEYIETYCPNTLLQIETNNLINKQGDFWVGIVESGSNTALNGVYHEIDQILTYEGVEEKVLNKRLRMDTSSFLDEMATNSLRGDFTGYIIPNGYFKKLTFTEATQPHYIGSPSWGNCQGDEFLFVGKYDFTLTTLPIPAGTYEVRIGYTANAQRGVAQIYFDGEPCGIPLDMTILASNPQIGWVADSNTDDNGVENDKMMRNRGYLKGPSSVLLSGTKTPLRNNEQALRRVLTTKTFDKTTTHKIRIKSVEDLTSRQFHLDYVEFVPSTVWESEGRD